MKRKPKVGDVLYSLNVGNAARNKPQVLTKVVVTKVGRKYFTIGEDYLETQFHLSDWREKANFMPNQVLYTSKEGYAEYLESNVISNEISKAFEYGRNTKSLPIEDLREIKRLILC